MHCIRVFLVVSVSIAIYSSNGGVEGFGFLGQGINLVANTINDGAGLAIKTINDGAVLATKTATGGIDLVGNTITGTLNVIGNVLGGGDNANNKPVANSQIVNSQFGNEPSETKKQWTYKRSPRSGSLSVTTQSGKILFPGEMNALQNAVQLEELLGSFTVKFPLARTGSKYTMVKYTNGLLVKAVFNINADDLAKGITGDGSGTVLPGVQVDEIIRFLTSGNIRFCIEVLEQNPESDFKRLPFSKSDWDSPLGKWANELSGVAGKTCFAVAQSGVADLKKQYPGGELGLFFNNQEKQMELLKKNLQNGNKVPTR